MNFFFIFLQNDISYYRTKQSLFLFPNVRSADNCKTRYGILTRRVVSKFTTISDDPFSFDFPQ